MTFSLIAKCSKTGMFGAIITSSSIAVGARCPYVRSKVGAVATQNITDPTLGPKLLDLMEHGLSATQAIEAIHEDTLNLHYRQLCIIDSNGCTSHFSGRHVLGNHAVHSGNHCIAAGNLLSSTGVPEAMANAFEESQDLMIADRLIHALERGSLHGGEEGPVHSAALLVADTHSFELINLRVDWDNSNPITTLKILWNSYKPQMQAYVERAIAPNKAPSYGVAGDC